jgi:UDP-glucuronate 4-epimerase
MVEATLTGGTFPVFGDGTQIRDFTYVGDVVDANLKAASAPTQPGAVINIAGGGSTTLAELIDAVGLAVGEPVPIERRPAQPGDVARTGGSIERAKDLLGWTPTTGIVAGIAAQVEWHRARHAG